MTDMLRPLSLDEVVPVPHGRTARRLEWTHLHPAIREEVERRLGSPVVGSESHTSGFTNGFASTLETADGSRYFVKAANSTAQTQAAASYAEEARKLPLLPTGLPAPRLLWSGDHAGWIVLVFEHVEGRPPSRPWLDDELEACLRALDDVVALTSDPDPRLRLVPLHEDLPTLLDGWLRIEPVSPDWPHLRDLQALAASFAGLPDAQHLVHADARDDNFLLTAEGHAMLCDWNWPGLGPAWLDSVILLASAHGDGVDADSILRRLPLTRDVPADHVDALLAALCGFMVEADLRPAPPWSPHLVTHRRWWAATLWSWLSQRRGWV